MFNLLPVKDGVCAPKGFFADGIAAGLKADNTLDMAFIYSDTVASVEALFTENRFQAAPLVHFQNMGEKVKSNFVLINAKNANAMTGDAGIADIEELFGTLKTKFPQVENPIMSSTGVIGVRLPKEKMADGFDQFSFMSRKGTNAAKAIMTTDSYHKEVAFKVELQDGSVFTIGAMAKGAGMINPSLATMLCFITTDADVPAGEMKALLESCVPTTFNAISVDGDTSTNDTVMLLANGKSGAYEKEAFREALHMIMHKLALDMVKDGEGARKLVAFDVTGAKSARDAEKAAKLLSSSLLVKTALFGEDPNWGRIASAIGASGAECDWRTLTIRIGDITLYEKGAILMDKEVEEKAAKVMQTESFKIYCDLGMGEGTFIAYGCDLGYEYVKINADYRT